MKKVLFVCYGSGHVRMVVPVARALRDTGRAEVQVLALTTAAPIVREAGLDLLQFKDFLEPADGVARAHGERLLRGMGSVADPQESIAYLGLGYAELEQDVGPAEAASRYAKDGRQAFLPRRTLQRILARVGPDLLVATNSPRAERAAIDAARALGIPSVCLVDLFCLDEVQWIGVPGYAERVCVLNEAVRRFLVAAGRQAGEVVVTGNPAFDTLRDQGVAQQGQRLRRERGWDGKQVLLWPAQTEPAFHPFNGSPGDPTLPARALAEVKRWVAARDDSILCLRPRAGETPPSLPDDPRFVLTGQDWPLHPLLHAVDLVATLNSTVGLEGHLAGARLLQVLGSVFDAAMPLQAYGIADEAVTVQGITAALDRLASLPRQNARADGPSASDRVLSVLDAFL
jgi:hypothetical protein